MIQEKWENKSPWNGGEWEGDRQKGKIGETLSWVRTQKSHSPDSINVWLPFYCCNIIQLRAVSFFKQRPRVCLTYDLPHTYTYFSTHACAECGVSLTPEEQRSWKQKWWFGRKKKKGVYLQDSLQEFLQEWGTVYLFGMMKIFPSKQPFVALVLWTACQICFSSPSCLHNATVTWTSTHNCLLPHRPQQVRIAVTVVMCVFLKGRERRAHFGRTITSTPPLGWII